MVNPNQEESEKGGVMKIPRPVRRRRISAKEVNDNGKSQKNEMFNAVQDDKVVQAPLSLDEVVGKVGEKTMVKTKIKPPPESKQVVAVPRKKERASVHPVNKIQASSSMKVSLNQQPNKSQIVKSSSNNKEEPVVSVKSGEKKNSKQLVFCILRSEK